jgi:cell volume regulation protein A
MTAVQVLGFIGILLIIGFLLDYLFRKTNFPDILILLAIGYVIGPVFNIINPSDIASASEIIATLALVIILFNGGLHFDFAEVLSNAPRAITLVILGVGIGISTTAAFAYYVLKWALLDSLLLGSILGGTSAAIVMPLITRARVPDKISTLLSLEAVLNSPIVIVLAVVILKVITGGETGVEISTVGIDIATRFLLGTAVGVGVGFFWLFVLTRMEREEYSDILTLAIVFALYFVVELINGSGVIFALVFGLILGNGVKVARFMRLRRTIESTEVLKRFHAEIFFFVKTFFFVYLGLIVTFDKPNIIIIGIMLSVLILFTRYVAVLLTSAGNRTLFSNTGILTTMYARGETAAVLAQIVFVSGIANASLYPDVIIIVVITTVVISALGIPIFGRKLRQQNEETGNGVSV